MLIAFFGAPHSGKTTIAMGLAYNLKLRGYAVEYVPENARHHMTKLRHKGEPITMPQPDLYYAERDQQKMYKETLPDSIIIADVLCNTGELYELKLGTSEIAQDLEMYDLVFFCPLFADMYAHFIQKDPNRIHALNELADIEKRALAVLAKYDLKDRLYTLNQPLPEERVGEAVTHVLERLGKVAAEPRTA